MSSILDFLAKSTDEQSTSNVEIDEPYFSVGTSHKYTKGIVYRGPYETENDGVCSAVRRHAAALRSTGIPVFLQSFSYTIQSEGVTSMVSYADLPQAVLDEVDHLTRCEFDQPVLTIQHVVPVEHVIASIVYPRYLQATDPNAVLRCRVSTIIFSPFERNTVSPKLADLLSKVSLVWVPCKQNKDALVRSGVPAKQIHVVPHPFVEGDPMLTASQYSKPSSTFRILNVAKWEPRKGQHKLIGAFLHAFGPKDDVRLILKTRDWGVWKGYPNSISDSISQWLQDEEIRAKWAPEHIIEKIDIMSKFMPREALAKLYGACQLYAASGHGEAFDMPAFDAKLACLPVVYVDGVGSQDYMTEFDYKVPSFEGPCHPQYGWEKDASWYDFDVKDMAAQLSKARADYLSGENWKARAFDRTPYTMKSVGDLMRSICNELVDSLDGSIREINVDAR